MTPEEREAAARAYVAELEHIGPVLGGTGFVCPRCGGMVSTEHGPLSKDRPALVPVARHCLDCGWRRPLLSTGGE